MRGVWRELAGLVLPVDCAGCGRPRTELCGACRGALARGGRGAGRVRIVPRPRGLPGVWAGAVYADEVRAVLLAHKERGALRLAEPLGAALAGAVRGLCEVRAGAGPLRLVPVPSARSAVAGRGHDPVRRIALAAAAELRRTGAAAWVCPVLRQRRAVADQAGLSARERSANVAGAIEVRGGASGPSVVASAVLVDDLVTTGATLAEAARAVAAAGGRVVGAAVVAAPRGTFATVRNGT
ncbi:ComF family protein [Streptomyces pinistramenti]|uniref:ComF family protein n=1 Tax=Streptomyces pinistramenti TaxID=2884812 RepID=UPI001D08355A|nr:phosphoribosyltransferase family protein [Streptomyces pinistramenti]MCB5912053.1 ComF family protein [Streptomyces pinistramenti]